ncbi:MAG: GntR family carbon starvation induced transcriptional regulator [Gammaproteobacteria bacterium]
MRIAKDANSELYRYFYFYRYFFAVNLPSRLTVIYKQSQSLPMSNNATKTLVESAYNRLRADIIEGRLTPNSKLRIEELRNQYETGASPLREALNRLAGEGFVTVAGQRGFRVSPVSLADLKDLTRMRILLECEAICDSIKYGDDNWEANIVASFHRLSKMEESKNRDFVEWEKRNDEFHEALVAASRSSWLLKFRQTLYEQHKRYRLLAILAHDETRDLHAEHTAIKDAAISRDKKAARKATEEHIFRTLQTDEEILAKLSQGE